ncbi:uncharacterized protein LOC142351496 isoform X2 [Convolutriloba macropyga]|uniref:uncharacterized protein LOC142351496 isoform X2 n=1 Tax=Convolutriloba macropyga TaxID=536237 RepID=UPI003F5244E8
MENTDNRAALGRDSGNDSQRRMRPSLYYDESEMTLSPNSISAYGQLLTATPTLAVNSPAQLEVSQQRRQSHATTSMIAPLSRQSSQKPSFASDPGWLEQQNSRTSMSGYSAGSSTILNRHDVIRYSSYKSDLMNANNTPVTKTLKTCKSPWKNKDPYQNNLILQVVIVLMSFCYWCCSILTVLSWYRLVHTSFYLDFLEGVDVELSCSLSLVSGLTGAASSALMFFFAVKPLRVRRSPEATDRLQTITIVLMFSIGISLCALIFCANVQQLFQKKEISIDFDGDLKQEYICFSFLY